MGCFASKAAAPTAAASPVGGRLASVGLGQYAAAFESAGYDDADSLAALTEDDLGEIAAFARITIPPGHRKKLLLASRTWRAEARNEAGAAGPSDRPPEPRARPEAGDGRGPADSSATDVELLTTLRSVNGESSLVRSLSPKKKKRQAANGGGGVPGPGGAGEGGPSGSQSRSQSLEAASFAVQTEWTTATSAATSATTASISTQTPAKARSPATEHRGVSPVGPEGGAELGWDELERRSGEAPPRGGPVGRTWGLGEEERAARTSDRESSLQELQELVAYVTPTKRTGAGLGPERADLWDLQSTAFTPKASLRVDVSDALLGAGGVADSPSIVGRPEAIKSPPRPRHLTSIEKHANRSLPRPPASPSAAKARGAPAPYRFRAQTPLSEFLVQPTPAENVPPAPAPASPKRVQLRAMDAQIRDRVRQLQTLRGRDGAAPAATLADWKGHTLEAAVVKGVVRDRAALNNKRRAPPGSPQQQRALAALEGLDNRVKQRVLELKRMRTPDAGAGARGRA